MGFFIIEENTMNETYYAIIRDGSIIAKGKGFQIVFFYLSDYNSETYHHMRRKILALSVGQVCEIWDDIKVKRISPQEF